MVTCTSLLKCTLLLSRCVLLLVADLAEACRYLAVGRPPRLRGRAQALQKRDLDPGIFALEKEVSHWPPATQRGVKASSAGCGARLVAGAEGGGGARPPFSSSRFAVPRSLFCRHLLRRQNAEVVPVLLENPLLAGGESDAST